MLVTSDWRCGVATCTYETGALGEWHWLLSARARDPAGTIGPPHSCLAAAAGNWEPPWAVLTWPDPALPLGAAGSQFQAGWLRASTAEAFPSLPWKSWRFCYSPTQGYHVVWAGLSSGPGTGKLAALCATGRTVSLVGLARPSGC